MKPRNGTRTAAAALTVTALAGLLAIPGTARAAVTAAQPTAQMTFQSASVAAGTQPEFTFITTGVPGSAVVYLQEEGAGEPWHSIGRIQATSGTVRAPADQAGAYEYRIVVASAAGSTLTASAPVALTVTSASGAAPSGSAGTSGSDCTVCRIARDALPWLALIVDPSSVWDTITSILSVVGGAIAALFGF